MRGKTGTVACVVLLLAGVAPLPAAAMAFGSLEVSAPGWQLISLPYNLTIGQSLFQTAGDMDGDGFDDLVVWRQGGGFVLFYGAADGFDLAVWRGANGGIPGTLLDTGSPPSFDSRPDGVDANGDGIADLAGYSYASRGCTEYPIAGPNYTALCTEAFVSQPVLAWGNASTPLRLSQEIDGAPHKVPNGPPFPTSLHLIPAVGPDTWANVFGEQVSPRSADGRTAAVTNFTVYSAAQGEAFGNGFAWQVNEPTPLANSPRPSRFLAAPDFDGDGYADIVTWAPPGQGQSGPLPGILTIYNGSADGLRTSSPLTIDVNGISVLIADFDGNGRPDVAYYRVLNADNAGPRTPYIDLVIGYTEDDGIHSFNWDQIQLEGPSIFLSAPPVRLQAGDIDGDGRADLAAMKYDTMSAEAGHLLVDVFLGVPVCTMCDRDTPTMTPSLSTEVQFTGTDIYANEAGLRVNLQADYDEDGLGDLTVGFYGGNSQRAPTSNSSFVAVMQGRDIVFRATGIALDADPGGVVYPMYRGYTVTAEAVGIGAPGDLELGFPGMTGGATLRINTTTLAVTSSDGALIVPAGLASLDTVVCIRAPCPGTLRVPLWFNWSIPNGDRFGLSLRQVDQPSTTFLARAPFAAVFHSGTAIVGDLHAESEGRAIQSGGWVRAGASLNLTSSLTVQFQGSNGIRPAEPLVWRLYGSANATVHSGDLNTSLSSPLATTRDWIVAADFTGLPTPDHLVYGFNVSVDADLPQFGDHLPLETDWATSHPVYVAAQIFDNESGVDPARIEYTWQNDIDPFLRWSPADWMPGQTAAEIVAHASIAFPEGNLSNIIWRAWDKAGNGPVESPIWGVKVDTQDVAFHDPIPDAVSWQNGTPQQISVAITAGTSGLNHSSVEFRLSNTGLFGFGPWRKDCGYPQELNPNGPTIMCYAILGPDGYRRISYANLTEGDQNWVQWRAASNASSELKNSDPYQIRMDSKPPQILAIEPNGKPAVPLGPIEMRVWAREGNLDTIAQRGLNLSAGSASYRVLAPGQTGYGPSLPLAVESVAGNHYAAIFNATLRLERGLSTIEVSVSEVDGQTARATATIRINQLPRVVVESTPVNLTLEQNTAIQIRANATDPDGDRFTYLWAPCNPSPRGGFPRAYSTNDSLWLTPLGGGAPSTNRTTGTFDICLTVSDGMDGVVRQVLTIHIVAQGSLPPQGTQPPGTTSAFLPISDGSLAVLLILIAAIVAVAFVLSRRRLRRPPDNL